MYLVREVLERLRDQDGIPNQSECAERMLARSATEVQINDSPSVEEVQEVLSI